MAAILHGSARVTLDVDIVYDRGTPNLNRLAEVLQPLKPALRGAWSGLRFKLDVTTLRNGLNFTLATDRGDRGLFGELTGGGSYNDLLRDSVDIDVCGVRLK